MNWKAKISLTSFILIPVIVGIAVWIWVYRPFVQQPESDVFLQKAPPPNEQWHVLIPNLTEARVVVLDRPHEPHELQTAAQLKNNRVRTFSITTNGMGLRNPPIGVKNGFRILCVGESVTFGWGVAREDSYPAQLAKLLNVEVINAGVPSARIEYSTHWIQNKAEQLQPDLILLTARPDWHHPHALQDFVNRIENAQRYIAPVPVGLILPPLSSFDRRGLSNANREIRKIQQSLSKLPILDLSPVFHKKRKLQGVRLEVKGDRQHLISHDNQILIDAENLPLKPGNPVLSKEITQAFEADLSLKEALMFDGGHPDEEGFAVFAEEVAKWIKKEGWYSNF